MVTGGVGVVTARIAVVTGAASGIGLASAARLAARGDVVVALDVRPGWEISGSADEVGTAGGRVVRRSCDVCDHSQVREVCDAVGRDFGGIDYVFSNAGIAARAPLTEMSAEAWDSVVDVNIGGAFNVCQGALPHMVGRQGAAVVLCASDYSIIGMENSANYAAAKTALYSLGKALAEEFAADGIRVNCVGPGPIDTPFLRSGRTADEHAARLLALSGSVPLRRVGRPEEVASVVDFLLSDRSSYVSGQLVQPNGGQVMW